MEANSTCENRFFWLRGYHRLQTKEQALRLSLSLTWSMVRSTSSCGNLDMMAVAVQQTPLVPIASVEGIFEPHVGASETVIRFIPSDARSYDHNYLFSSVEKPWRTLNCILLTRIPPNQSGGGRLSAHNYREFSSDLWYLTWPRMGYPVPTPL